MPGPSRSLSGRSALARCWIALSFACSAPSTLAVSVDGTSGEAGKGLGTAGAGGAPQLEPPLNDAPLPRGSRTANLFHERLACPTRTSTPS